MEYVIIILGLYEVIGVVSLEVLDERVSYHIVRPGGGLKKGIEMLMYGCSTSRRRGF